MNEYMYPSNQRLEAVSISPDTEIAISSMCGTKSSRNCCTAIAPRSFKRLWIAIAQPAMTITAEMSRPWNMIHASTLRPSIGGDAANPKTYA